MLRQTIAGVLAAAVLAVCALLTGLAWASASPPVSSPDEDYHLASIWCPPPAEASGCTMGTFQDKPAVLVPTLMAGRPCYVGLLDASAACQYADAERMIWSTRFDQGDYPGPYFRFMHSFVEGDPDASVQAMREFNVRLAVLMIGAALVLTPAASRRGALLGVLAASVPLVLFIVASVNPSSWSFIGLTTCWIALHAVAVTPRRQRARRFAAALLAVAGAWLASVARGDTAPFVAIIVVAVALASLRGRDWVWLGTALASVGVGVASMLTSGQASGVAPTGVGHDDALFVLGHDLTEILQVPFGVLGLPPWGALGWLDLPMPSTVVVPMLALAGFLIYTGLTSLERRRELALLGVGGALLVLPFYMLMRNLDLAGIQPRYFMALVPLFFALTLWRNGGSESVTIGRAQGVLAWLSLTIAQSVALLTVLRRYTTGLGGTYWPGIDATWWWASGPTPGTWWVTGTVAFGVLALAFIPGLVPGVSGGLLRRPDAVAGGVAAGGAGAAGSED